MAAATKRRMIETTNEKKMKKNYVHTHFYVCLLFSTFPFRQNSRTFASNTKRKKREQKKVILQPFRLVYVYMS